MTAYDKKLCISNVYYLTKEQGKKLGDVETTAGVSAGYFSRLNKEESTANPSIEVLASVADQLGVTVDALISRDYSAMSSSERYVSNFLDKLIKKSNSGESIWERETKAFIEGLGCDQDGDAIHPLYEHIYDGTVQDWRCVYQSLFNPGERYYIVGDCFKLSIDPKQTFYLMKVSMFEQPEPPMDEDEFELYLVKNRHPESICRSWTYGNHVFARALKKLYEAAAESSRHVKLSSNVRSAIDSFMTELQTLGDDLDGELPF